MWRKHANILTPLTKVCSTKVNCNWTDVEENTVTKFKKIVCILIIISDFTESDIVNTYSVDRYCFD